MSECGCESGCVLLLVCVTVDVLVWVWECKRLFGSVSMFGRGCIGERVWAIVVMWVCVFEVQHEERTTR